MNQQDDHTGLIDKRRMPPNLKQFLIRVQGGKNYLPAAYRIVWFRDECPDWGVTTTLIEGGQEAGFATVQAFILNSEGRTISSGIKTETRQDFPAGWVEKAETGAIARALAVAGWGTQFAPELDEEIDAQGAPRRPADSPVRAAQQRIPAQRQSDLPRTAHKHETVDGALIHPKTVDPATGRETVIKRDETNPHFAPRTTDADAAEAQACRQGMISFKGWMVHHKLDANDRGLRLHLLNCLGTRGGEGRPYWNSSKELTAADWQAVGRRKVMLTPEGVQALAQAYADSLETVDDHTDTLMDVPATVGGPRFGDD